MKIWAINYTPMTDPHSSEFKICEERFETAEDAFRWLEEQGVDYMEVLVDHVYEFFKDCNEGTCTSAGSCSYGVC